MLDTEIWDIPCQQALDTVLREDAALDGFTLMLYGASYTTDRATIEKMCSYEAYVEKVRARLAPNPASLHETVRVAMKKAIGEY